MLHTNKHGAITAKDNVEAGDSTISSKIFLGIFIPPDKQRVQTFTRLVARHSVLTDRAGNGQEDTE